MTKRFSSRLASQIDATKYMKIRSGDHRYIHIWVIVREGRVFVRSWNDKPAGWFRAFLVEPVGSIEIDGRDVPVRARPVKSAKLNDAVCVGYGEKYATKANQKYVKGFATAKRKANTLELLPG
jgi:hypothetical protein